MPGFPFPGRPGGEHDEPLLDMILDRRPLPPGAPPEAHDLVRLLAALASPAEPGELAGEAAARAAFTRTSPAGISSAARPSRSRRSARYGSRRLPRHGSRRPAWRRSRPGRVRVGLATALVVAVAGLGAVAAYVGVLPGPIQLIAHVTGGAPARHHDVPPSTAARGARPDAQPGHRPVGPPTSSPADPASTAPAAGQSGVPAASGESSRSGHGPAVGKCPQFSLPSQSSTPGPVYIPPQPKKAACSGPVAPAGSLVIPKP